MKAHYNPVLKKDGIILDQILTGGHQLVDRPIQQIQEESEVQNYDIGTRLVDADRVFRYCKAGTAITKPMMSGHCGNLPTECNTHAVASLKGTYEVTILDTTAAGSRPVDYYAGGYIWTMNLTSGIFEMLQIKGSTVGNGTSITLTLVEPLMAAIPATTWITAWPSVYCNILYGNSSFMAQVVIPLRPVQNGYYFWGQTWGPCFGTVVSTVPGRDGNNRELFYNIDGGLITGADAAVKTNGLGQRAGFLITNTTPGGAGYGDQLYMLQLSP